MAFGYRLDRVCSILALASLYIFKSALPWLVGTWTKIRSGQAALASNPRIILLTPFARASYDTAIKLPLLMFILFTESLPVIDFKSPKGLYWRLWTQIIKFSNNQRLENLNPISNKAGRSIQCLQAGMDPLFDVGNTPPTRGVSIPCVDLDEKWMNWSTKMKYVTIQWVIRILHFDGTVCKFLSTICFKSPYNYLPNRLMLNNMGL